eukprot:1803940-Rhodomonas_salina.6
MKSVAEEALQNALDEDPANVLARRLLGTVRGEKEGEEKEGEGASLEEEAAYAAGKQRRKQVGVRCAVLSYAYAAALFDGYAEDFERELVAACLVCYALPTWCQVDELQYGVPGLPMRLIRVAQYCLAYHARCLRACYAMSGTDMAHFVLCLRACYAMSGTGAANHALCLRDVRAAGRDAGQGCGEWEGEEGGRRGQVGRGGRCGARGSRCLSCYGRAGDAPIALRTCYAVPIIVLRTCPVEQARARGEEEGDKIYDESYAISGADLRTPYAIFGTAQRTPDAIFGTGPCTFYIIFSTEAA